MILKKRHLILYSSGSLATAVSYQAFATYIQFLYIDTFGLKAAWVGIVWSIYGLWNAVNDPLAGYISDRTHTRWGRRIPWIAGLFIPLSVTFLFPVGAAWADVGNARRAFAALFPLLCAGF